MQEWFFLRGLIRESGHWLDFPREFSYRFPEDKLHFLEIPGSGKRCREDSPLSIPEMVDALQADFLQQRQHSEKPFIFAVSLGAMVTLEWLNRCPGQFAGAVLCNTSVRGLSPMHHRLHPRNYPDIFRLLLTPHSLEAREAKVLSLVSNRPERHAMATLKYTRIQQARPMSRRNAVRQIYAASRYRLKDRPADTPILLLNSAGDRFVNPVCTEALGKWLTIPWQTHPSAGHDLPLDEPEWVLERVDEWRQHLGVI